MLKLCLIFTTGVLLAVQSQQLLISVDGQHGVDSDSCGGVLVPCATLHKALDRLRNSSGEATVRINPGEYTIEYGEEIRRINNIAIIGSGREETVIKCSTKKNKGLFFYFCNNVSVESITLQGCGYKSYSLIDLYVYIGDYTNMIPFQPAALAFLASDNVSVQGVNIKDSHGSGLILHSSSCNITESSLTGGKGTSEGNLGAAIMAINQGFYYSLYIQQRLSITDSIISDNNYTNSATKLLSGVLSQGAVTLISVSGVYIDSSVITNNSRGLTIYSTCGSTSDISLSNVSMYSNWNKSTAFGDHSCPFETRYEIKLNSVEISDTIEILSNTYNKIPQNNVSFTTSDSSNGQCLTLNNDVFTVLLDCQNRSFIADSCPTYDNVSIQFKAIDLMLNTGTNNFEPGYCYNRSNFTEKFNISSRGKCPIPYSVLKSNIPRCWDNHNGTLCGQCLEGYSVAINSPYLECVPCGSSEVIVGWILLIVLEFIPITVMVVIIAVLNVNLNQGSLKSYIFFCQILTIPFPSVSYPSWFVVGYNYQTRFTDFLLLPISIWNLGFINYPSCNLLGELNQCSSTSICISTNTTPLGAIVFWYVIGFYPFLLLALSYAFISMYDRGYRCIVGVIRPVHRLLARFWHKFNIQPSLPHTVASVYTLCFTQLAATSLKLLHFTSYDNEVRFFYDGQKYFSDWQHLLSGTLALIVLMVFIIVPVVYLSAYPFKWFQKCLNKVKIRKDLLISVTDIFTAPYSDGTQNTWDYRCYASSHLTLQLLLMVLYYIPSYDYKYVIFGFQIGFCGVFLISLVAFRPYKRKIHSLTDMLIVHSLVTLSILYLVISLFQPLPLINVVIISLIVPLYLVVAISYCLSWFYRKLKYFVSNLINANKRISNQVVSDNSEMILLADFDATELPDRMINPTEYEELDDADLSKRLTHH